MAEYYLVAQLPSLDGISERMPLPITEERFFELCDGALGKKAREELRNVTLLPEKSPGAPSSSPLLQAWTENERKLRLALGKVRAEKLKKPFDTQNQPISGEYLKTAAAALEMEDPMEAEQFLSRFRLTFLETLRPLDSFSEDFVFYYGLKLKLMKRIRQFDQEAGAAAYQNIYNAIINEDRSEA